MSARDALVRRMRKGYRPYLHTLEKYGLVTEAQALGIVPKQVSSNPERTKERGYSKKYYAKVKAARTG